MAKSIIKGKYPYKDAKKMSNKERKKEEKRKKEELLRKEDKKLKMQCNCNHLDSKHNKAHFKKNDDGTITCKICGGTIINNPDALTKEAAKSASTFVYTVFSHVRNKLSIDEDMDKKITKALMIVARMPELLELMQDGYGNGMGKKKKNKKNGKNKKNKNKGYNRITY